MRLELKRCNKFSLVQNQHVPELCRAEKARKGQGATVERHLGMLQAIATHDVLHQREKTVHILPGRHTGALALVGLARFKLLQPYGLAITPERLYRFPRFAFIVRQFDCHASSLLPVTAESGILLVA